MSKKITIYTLSWCSHCKALKEFLNEKKLEYTNIDVEENEDAGNEIIERSGQEGFPVIDINGELLIGFNKPKLFEALK